MTRPTTPVDAPLELGEGALIQVDSGSPDGMTVDDEGFVWTAVWGAARVLRVSPDGDIERTVHLPCRQPTSVAIGGPGGTRLLVTSAWYGLAEPTAADGAIWTGDVHVSAPPARPAVLRR